MKARKVKGILLFLFLVFLFSIFIFFVKNFFISEEKVLEEEKYIDISEEKFEKKFDDEKFSKILENLRKIEKEENKKKIIYNYIPDSLFLEEKFEDYKNYFDTFFYSFPINSKIKNLEIVIYKDEFEVRWRLKDKKIHIFWLYFQEKKEALAVSIHEFWHFVDLYILKKWVFKDLSYDFYDISWEDRNILKKNSKKEDFVSGYSMTNMYEDFAESFTFYVLHNKEFEIRAKFSEKLQKKYDFFKKNVFLSEEFITDEFSFPILEKNIWDTTKQDFDFEKFKKYLETF